MTLANRIEKPNTGISNFFVPLYAGNSCQFLDHFCHRESHSNLAKIGKLVKWT